MGKVFQEAVHGKISNGAVVCRNGETGLDTRNILWENIEERGEVTKWVDGVHGRLLTRHLVQYEVRSTSCHN